MAASDKLITIDNDYLVLDEVYQGESLDLEFDLTDLFGETITPADWSDVLIYLYHKYSKENVGYDATDEAWTKVDATVTFTGDVAEITMTNDRLEDGRVGIYRYLIELSTDLINRKTAGDCFILKYATDE